MKRFYENFSDEEANEIVKQFLSWTELEADDGELPDDIIGGVMELAISKEFASREETYEMVSPMEPAPPPTVENMMRPFQSSVGIRTSHFCAQGSG